MKISYIVPVYNEEESIQDLYESLSGILSGMDHDYEIIMVDDGSADGSLDRMKTLSEKDKAVRIIGFMRNYGQTAALQAGFQAASGEVVVTLDADLQNDPSDIPGMLRAYMDSGCDVVSGWRHPRRDPFFRIFVSSIANLIISRICGLKLHDFGCTLKVYNNDFVKELNLYGEMHRFIPAFIHWNGGRVIEKKISHNPRRKGRSSYGMGRIPRVILDLITTKFLTTYSTKPIHVFGSLGLMSIFTGFVLSVYVTFRTLYLGGIWISPLFFMAVFLIGLGLILILMGIIAEIAVRIFFANTGNLPYRIRDRIG